MNRVLEVGYTLKLSGKEFKIIDIVGKGASSVTYLAEQGKTEHILKECNPLGIDMHRNELGELVADTKLSRQKFEECLERFKKGADKQLSFRLTEDSKNPTSNIQDIYDANGTAYIDMTYFGGKTYDKADSENLYDLFRRMKALAQIVGHYHKLGFLHLDIKPQNIYTIPETPEMVMMFDFDSVTPINDIDAITSSSYTDVWAAPEQKMPKYRNQICEATDFFAIGEIVFFKLFGKHSEENDRYSFSQYEYSVKNKWFENVNPRVFSMITDFLHKTLSCSAKKRYQNAKQLVLQLDKIIECSNPKEPFLKNSLPNVSGFFTGRDAEIEEIHKKLQENNVLFLSGIGGIGKSELAKHYAEVHKDSYDAIVFASFLHDIQTMIINDSYVPIHNFFQYPEEKPNEYLERKMKELVKLCNERTLIIVDNFDTTEDENLDKLLSLNCKMLITTRRDFTEAYTDSQLDLGTLTNPFDVFNEHYKKPLSDDERKCVDEIIEIICGHTMTVELLAKQMMAGRIKPEKMLEKLKDGGISESGKEKVFHANEKGEISRENTYGHIQALFDLSDLNKDEKYVLANLSLIPHTGISAELFGEWCQIDNFDTINNLAIEGWIRWDRNEDYISLHPVVAEMVVGSINNSNIWKRLIRLFRLDLICREWHADFRNESSLKNSCLYRMVSVFKKEQIVSKEVVYFLRDTAQHFSEKLYDHNSAFTSISAAKNKMKRVRSLKVQETLEIQVNYGVICDYLGFIKQDNRWHKAAIDAYIEVLSNENVKMMPSLSVASIQQSLACAYDNTGDLQKATQHFEYAIALLQAEKESEEINLELFRVYNNLGIAYCKRKDFDTALRYYEEAFKLYTKGGVDAEHFAKLHHDIGLAMFYSDTHTIDEAKSYAEGSLRLRRTIWEEESYYVAMSKVLLGKIYAHCEDDTCIKKALTLLQEAVLVYQKIVGNSHTQTIEIFELINHLQK